MKNRLITILASFFYLGYSPIAPGTMGTIGAIPLYYLLTAYLTNIQYLIAAIILTVFGIIISFKAVALYNEDDAKEIVIDEVVGYLVTMILIAPNTLNIVLGFFLFRFFDIVKPFPVRRFERLRGGYGVVMDDVVAGIMACLTLHIINYFIVN